MFIIKPNNISCYLGKKLFFTSQIPLDFLYKMFISDFYTTNKYY